MMKFLSTIFLLFAFGNLLAQENSFPKYKLEAKIGYGFIITHSPSMEYITNQHLENIEFIFEKSLNGYKEWHQWYSFPSFGFGFNYFNLNNPKHLGHGFSLAPHYNFFIVKGSKTNVKLKTALGLGYITKPFDSQENYKNVAIGSGMNLFFSLKLQANIRLSKYLDIIIGPGFSHFSNTSFSKPNLGINIANIEGGLAYHFGEKVSYLKKRDEEIKEFKAGELSFLLRGGFGINEIYPAEGDKYFASVLTGMGEKRLNRKSSLGSSFDVYHNPANRAELANDSIFINKGWETVQMGIGIYHVLHLGDFGVGFKWGFYLKNENEDLGFMYHEFFGRFGLNERLNGVISLKTHFAAAEYLMLGLSYKL